MDIGHPRAWWNRLRRAFDGGTSGYEIVVEVRVTSKDGKVTACRINKNTLKAAQKAFEQFEHAGAFDNNLRFVSSTAYEAYKNYLRLHYELRGLLGYLYWYDKPKADEKKDRA